MNDSSEISYFDSIIDKHFKDVEINNIARLMISSYKHSREIIHNTYLACFSKEKDMLSQWRAYANDGTGVAIGINFSKLEIPMLNIKDNNQVVLGNKVLFSEVIYNDEKVHELINEISNEVNLYSDIVDSFINKGKELENALDKLSLISKNNYFKEEKEVRLIFRDVPNDAYVNLGELNRPKFISERKFYIKNGVIAPYHEFDLKNMWNSGVISEIMLGPKCKLTFTDRDFILFLKDNGLDIDKVNVSEGTYK